MAAQSPPARHVTGLVATVHHCALSRQRARRLSRRACARCGASTMSLRGAVRHIVQPRIILPVLLTAALLAVAFNLGDLGKVLGRIQTIPIWVMAVALAMAVAYLGVKCWQLHYLLSHLRLHPGAHRLVLAFSVGELAVTLPFGIFAQNWMLSATSQDDDS